MTDLAPSGMSVNSLAPNPGDPLDHAACACSGSLTATLRLRGMAVFFALAGLVICITLTGGSGLRVVCLLRETFLVAIAIALPFYMCFSAGLTASLSVSRMTWSIAALIAHSGLLFFMVLPSMFRKLDGLYDCMVIFVIMAIAFFPCWARPFAKIQLFYARTFGKRSSIKSVVQTP